jgi:aspartate kinase
MIFRWPAIAQDSKCAISLSQEETMIVLKFGGTSVQDAAAISNLVKIVQSRQGPRLVVVSALAKVTDGLLQAALYCEQGNATAAKALAQDLRKRHLQVGAELSLSADQLAPIEQWFNDLDTMVQALAALKEVSPRSRDALAAVGELCSSRLVEGAFAKAGLPVHWADARKLIVTDSEFNNAQVDFHQTEARIQNNLIPMFATGIVVTQGFIGADPKGTATTLGRGGSDYSGAVFGAGLKADKVEIWTDVDGILSTDPRLVPEAIVIRRLHFSEAAEMAYFGAKVLHPATIFPALAKKIPVWILNSRNPTAAGTEITFADNFRTDGICGIAFKKNVALVNIYSTRMMGAHGFLKSVFDIFARYKLSVDLISTSEVNISLTLEPNYSPEALRDARKALEEFSSVEIHNDRAMVSVIGGGIRTTPGLAGRIFSELKDINIQMISMGASELNISFVVHTAQTSEVVQRLHSSLIQPTRPSA